MLSPALRRWPSRLFAFFMLVLAPMVCGGPYDPAWAGVTPKRTVSHRYEQARSSEENGAALARVIESLNPGDRLEIGAGTYSVARMWNIGASGTSTAPIWIVAAPGARVVFTRPDAKQNVLNVGQGAPVTFLCLRGFEITGGGHGLRLHQCSDVWIDGCHIHHTGEVCLSANSANTKRLYLTRNHIHDGGGHAEGMYLGANHGEHTMSESVVALNHIHDCRGDQGDGIEVKQGSWGNLVAENHIHDTQYPCITVYGTAGKPVNVIERNLCYRSGDHTMQVQGEAIVRNNVLIAGGGAGLASTDHQGKTRDLHVVHNTIVNTGHAFNGSSWGGREGMVLANNILYSRDANALNFPSGSAGVIVIGNVVVGSGPREGCVKGRGLEDFVALTWDAAQRDATPSASAPFAHADAKFLKETDASGKPRRSKTSGAIVR